MLSSSWKEVSEPPVPTILCPSCSALDRKREQGQAEREQANFGKFCLGHCSPWELLYVLHGCLLWNPVLVNVCVCVCAREGCRESDVLYHAMY